MFQNRKTYGLVALGLGVIAAVSFGWIVIDPQVYQQVINAVTLAAIAALRAGIK